METNNSDLPKAISFVTHRIEEQATRFGSPLSNGERSLLFDLPKIPFIPYWQGGRLGIRFPRDFQFERLCILAKGAIREDFDLGSKLNWQFVAAVLKLNRHPMYWLLGWASLKTKEPWWDRLLLWSAGLLFVGGAMWATISTTENAQSTEKTWITIGAAYVIILVALAFALKYFEIWQLKRTIQSSKNDARSICL